MAVPWVTLPIESELFVTVNCPLAELKAYGKT